MITPAEKNNTDRSAGKFGCCLRTKRGLLVGLVVAILAAGTTTALFAQSKTIVFIPKSTDVTYWLFLRKGAADKAKELGYTVQYQGVSRESPVGSYRLDPPRVDIRWGSS